MFDYKNHCDNVYPGSKINKLGWFEETPQPSLDLILSCNLKKDAAILDVGCGSVNLIKNLLQESYNNLIVADISKVALDRSRKLLNANESGKVKWVVDDITNPKILTRLTNIDLWHDRVVLPVVIDDYSRSGYLETLKMLVRVEGFVIIAVLSPEFVNKTGSIYVKNYDYNMIEEFLGGEFKLLKHFSYSYKIPSGDLRPFFYTLFQRLS
ncbi:MAG: class I SAM-dependent methyltransferase [Ignavibacteriaceae bacterium]|nr:class I SAM-dependent methyltransferase [Ignavibacteriaceae bacterium]